MISSTSTGSRNNHSEFLGGNSESFNPDESTIAVVVTKPKFIQWQVFDNLSTAIYNPFRRIQTRLGSFISKQVHWEALVSGEESISYKRPGVGSSQICNYDIPNNREGRYFNTPSDGQHCSPVVIIENAGDKESTISQKKKLCQRVPGKQAGNRHKLGIPVSLN